MAHRKVNPTKRIKTPQGLRYCPIVESGNGRANPDYVVVDGKQERHVEGADAIARNLSGFPELGMADRSATTRYNGAH